MVHLAAKLATSKALLATCPPVFVTMLVAPYNEKNRMSTKQEHPNGEHFLVNKACGGTGNGRHAPPRDSMTPPRYTPCRVPSMSSSTAGPEHKRRPRTTPGCSPCAAPRPNA